MTYNGDIRKFTNSKSENQMMEVERRDRTYGREPHERPHQRSPGGQQATTGFVRTNNGRLHPTYCRHANYEAETANPDNPTRTAAVGRLRSGGRRREQTPVHGGRNQCPDIAANTPTTLARHAGRAGRRARCPLAGRAAGTILTLWLLQCGEECFDWLTDNILFVDLLRLVKGCPKLTDLSCTMTQPYLDETQASTEDEIREIMAGRGGHFYVDK